MYAKKKPYNLIRCTLDILNDKITVLQNRRTITAVKMTVRSKKNKVVKMRENTESRGVNVSILGFEVLPAKLQSVCVWPPPSR